MKHGTLLVERRAVGPFAVNSYLVGCLEQGEAALIDAGGDSQKFLSMAKEHEMTITKLLLTHAHIDHIGGLEEIKKHCEAKIYLHKDDREIYSSAAVQGRFFGLNVEQPPQAEVFIEEGMSLAVGNHKATVLHTPGHSAGSVCYYFPEVGVLFSGDLLFQGSIGRTDLPGASGKSMMASLQRIVRDLPDDTVVYPGHMGETTIAAEKRSNPFLSGGW